MGWKGFVFFHRHKQSKSKPLIAHLTPSHKEPAKSTTQLNQTQQNQPKPNKTKTNKKAHPKKPTQPKPNPITHASSLGRPLTGDMALALDGNRLPVLFFFCARARCWLCPGDTLGPKQASRQRRTFSQDTLDIVKIYIKDSILYSQ